MRMIDGKPLIYYSIEAAQQSKILDAFVVDTDDDNIANIASEAGALVLKRPTELAQDHSSVVDVALRVINKFEEKGETFDIIVLLQPTSPIRTGNNIDEAITLLLKDKDTEGVISVVAMKDTHPARMYQMANEQLMPLDKSLEIKRRQDLEPVYYRNGCIYAIKVEALKHQRSFMPLNKKGYIMPSAWLANIDDERDLIITEALVKVWKEGRI